MLLLRWATASAVALSVAGFAGYLVYAPTDSYTTTAAAQLDADLQVSSLPGTTTLTLILTWVPLLLATLATLLRRRLAARQCPPTPAGAPSTLKRLLAWQLPPRGFLAGWCGGLCVGEGLLVALWLGINGWWFGQAFTRNMGELFQDTWQERVGKAGLTFGQMMAPNLMLLFLPVPHTSLVPWLTGLSRNALIRYHRWMGHGTMWVLTTHSVLYYVYWAASPTDGGFWANFSSWGNGTSTNNLAGSLAFFCGLALWATALTWFRRRFYAIFFRFHIACFLGFFLLSCAHYAACWTYFAPGLLLYAADLGLRAGQLANATTVTAARVADSAATVTLQMRADPGVVLRPRQEVWLMAPAISRWQWHPFTVASGTGNTLTLHVKRYGAFTKSLVSGLRKRNATMVRLAGPIGHETTADCELVPATEWAQHEVVVLIGGGVGITALLSMMRWAAAQHSAGRAQDLPRRMYCVWAARSLGEFKALDAPLLAAATAPDSWLQLRLHHTVARSSRSLAIAPLAPVMTMARFDISGMDIDLDDDAEASGGGGGGGAVQLSAAAGPGRTGSSLATAGRAGSSSLSTSPSKLSKTSATGSLSSCSALPGGSAAPVAPHYAPLASPYGWSLLRPVQPKSFGAAHLAAVYLLTFLGAFCAALLAASYAAQVEDAWKGGMVYCVLLSALALGLPFGVAVFPVHLFRYRAAAAAAHAGGAAAQLELVAPLQDAVEDACQLDHGALRARGTGALVPVQQGRPDFEGLLQEVAEDCPACGTVAVYAGGPKGLMTGVSCAVSALNAARPDGSPYFELHREAVEL